MKKLIASLLFVLILTSCGRSDDFVYNEVVSSSFLQSMETLDKDQADLHRGDYTSTQDANRTAAFKEIGFRLRDLNQQLDQVKDVPHSQKAEKFAQGLTQYYQMQISYYELLKRYAEATEPADQEKLLQELDASYGRLNVLPDQLKAVQEEFFAEAGISPAK